MKNNTKRKLAALTLCGAFTAAANDTAIAQDAQPQAPIVIQMVPLDQPKPVMACLKDKHFFTLTGFPTTVSMAAIGRQPSGFPIAEFMEQVQLTMSQLVGELNHQDLTKPESFIFMRDRMRDMTRRFNQVNQSAIFWTPIQNTLAYSQEPYKPCVDGTFGTESDDDDAPEPSM